MTLEDAQKDVDRWIQANGGYFDTSVNLARLLEEAGELAHDLLRSTGHLNPSSGDQSPERSDEFGDVLFVLCVLANQNGVSLADSLRGSLKRFETRDKNRHPNS